jgi:magnesium-transporting ATPase (P-type)
MHLGSVFFMDITGIIIALLGVGAFRTILGDTALENERLRTTLYVIYIFMNAVNEDLYALVSACFLLRGAGHSPT